jgi:hypothetical protein
VTLFAWFRSLLQRWFGAKAARVLRRGRLTIHRAAEVPRAEHGSQERRIAEIADASLAGAVSTLERLDSSLPAGVSAAGTLVGDRTATLKLARAILGRLDPAAPVGTEPPIIWLRRGAPDIGDGGE